MEKNELKVALVQMTSTGDVVRNFEKIMNFVSMASSRQVSLISFPENMLYSRDPEKNPPPPDCEGYIQLLQQEV